LISLGLSKLLFDEFKAFQELNLKSAWDRGLTALLSNIFRRTQSHKLSMKQ
jgi:hypothetical protein